ncbi:MAG TPA: hypothetical protein VFN25_15775 [Dokdonella sp.]|uniref:hypothetical protein n=1 Tax=Dokdonella sp. TaxID=2291710 RepID=UPI002D805E48|nr:hypothetical protein [Dokdonella sp.]HET9034349.1 hypothetical protein [Dokdonella sp.]
MTNPRSPLPALMLAWLSIAILASSTHAFAVPPIKHYIGTAFDLKGNELYTETHWTSGEAEKTERLVLFQCPDGKAFARKHIEDTDEATAPLFELDDGRYGYREGVRLSADGKREVFVRRKSDQQEQMAMVESVPRLVIDAGFDRFIVKHWDELVSGQEQKVEFLLPSRLRTYSFVLSPVGPDSIDGAPVQRFRLELDSWFGFALPSIDMAYASDTKALREYSGVSNIRDNDGNNLKVRIEFPAAAQSTSFDPQTLATAEAARLDGRCKL